MFTFNDDINTANIVVILATLTAFVTIHVRKYNAKHVDWNRMNILAAIIISLTLCSIIPQYFLFGRSQSECSLLHHFAGSFYYATNGLVKVFFLARSNMIADKTSTQAVLGRALMLACLTEIVSAVVLFNVTVGTAVLPGLDVCVVILNPVFAIAFIVVIPTVLDLIINLRFFYFLFVSIKVTSTASGGGTKAPMRLLRVTCLLSISSMMASLGAVLCVFGVVPLSDPSLLTPIIVTEQAYNACAMAWPAIIIRLLKMKLPTGGVLSGPRGRNVDIVPIVSGGQLTSHQRTQTGAQTATATEVILVASSTTKEANSSLRPSSSAPSRSEPK